MHECECPNCGVMNLFDTTNRKSCWNCREPLILITKVDENNKPVVTAIVDSVEEV